VRKVLSDAKSRGPGKRYLVQHSAGSGKSNSIAWLAHQIIGLATDATGSPRPSDGRGVRGEGRPLFDSVIVVTDRRVLDRQIRDTIKQFTQVSATIGAVK
jgi:type I restriction enzyme R subunit